MTVLRHILIPSIIIAYDFTLFAYCIRQYDGLYCIHKKERETEGTQDKKKNKQRQNDRPTGADDPAHKSKTGGNEHESICGVL